MSFLDTRRLLHSGRECLIASSCILSVNLGGHVRVELEGRIGRVDFPHRCWRHNFEIEGYAVVSLLSVLVKDVLLGTICAGLARLRLSPPVVFCPLVGIVNDLIGK